MSDWRPIETAPSDSLSFIGRVLLKRETVHVDDETGERHTNVRYVQVGKLMPGGWSLALDGVRGLTGGSALLHLHPPTHWMPLPDTPEREDGDGPRERPPHPADWAAFNEYMAEREDDGE